MDREKALQALEQIRMFILSVHHTYDIPTRGYQNRVETIRKALTAPDAVDVEALKRETMQWMVKIDKWEDGVECVVPYIIDHLASKGLLRTADDELKRVTQALEQCLSFLIRHNMVDRVDEGILTLRYPSHSDAGLGTAEQAIDFALKNIDDAWTDRCAFLEAWQHGDLSEWPEYKAMIAEVKK